MSDNKPVKEFRAGPISLAIWSSEVERDGRTITRYSAKPQKRYYDKQSGEWKTSDYFFPDDLARLRLLTEKAFEWMVLKEPEGEAGS